MALGPSGHFVVSPISDGKPSLFHLDVLDFCNTLCGNLESLTEGNSVRATVFAMALVQNERLAVLREGDGLRAEFLDAALLVIADRQGRAADDAMMDRPIPYALSVEALVGSRA